MKELVHQTQEGLGIHPDIEAGRVHEGGSRDQCRAEGALGPSEDNPMGGRLSVKSGT